MNKLLDNLLTASTKASDVVSVTLNELLKSLNGNPEMTFKAFSFSLKYHQELVENTKQIIECLKDLKEEQIGKFKDVLEVKPFYEKKILEVMKSLNEIDFIPKDLSVCPKCGNFFGKQCEKEIIIVNKKVIGYTYKCRGEYGTTGEIKKGREV